MAGRNVVRDVATYPGTLSGIDDETSLSNCNESSSGTNPQPSWPGASGLNASGMNQDSLSVRMERTDQGPDNQSSSDMTSKNLETLKTDEHLGEYAASKTCGPETELHELPLNKANNLDSEATAAAAAAAEDASGAVGVSSPSSQFDSSCSTMDSPCLNCSQVFEEAKTNGREDIFQPIDERMEVRFSTVRVVSSSAALFLRMKKVITMKT